MKLLHCGLQKEERKGRDDRYGCNLALSYRMRSLIYLLLCLDLGDKYLGMKKRFFFYPSLSIV